MSKEEPTESHKPIESQGGRLVLASGSPRRRALLEQIGVVPDLIDPVEIDEGICAGELPRDMAVRLSVDKAQRAALSHSGAFILAADTVVAVGRRVLSKPSSQVAARNGLNLLSGRAHRVFTSIALIDPAGQLGQRVVVTRVSFKRLHAREIEDYVSSGEWEGKAGGYAIQGRAAVYIRKISGSYSGVVGLPLYETAALLRSGGYLRY